LKSTKWQLDELNGGKVVTQRVITLEFTSDGKISGNGGCNVYGGGYTQTGSALKFTDIFSTQMACDDLQPENKFFAALQKAGSFKVKNSKLYLYSDGTAIVVFVKSKN
jgi:putative lipoprotein